MFTGYVQVYTGNGKGKTTAAVGLTIRAAGCGMKVFFAQFIKSAYSSEFYCMERFCNLITLRQYGRGFVRGKPASEDIEAAKRGLAESKEVMLSADFQVVVLDEINVALRLGVLELQEVVKLIQQRPPNVELVLTGRDADTEVIELADLVTEFKEIKHYFSKGVPARQGIEF
ncbi:MAG: cob(I)yrinic acid a,c-diamide adenosyltransferase [Nitrospirae bacterium]|nr:cob(I)yrinic acid a,c-diamide adenosyltransferase [Nitrospirota bacterium]